MHTNTWCLYNQLNSPLRICLNHVYYSSFHIKTKSCDVTRFEAEILKSLIKNVYISVTHSFFVAYLVIIY